MDCAEDPLFDLVEDSAAGCFACFEHLLGVVLEHEGQVPSALSTHKGILASDVFHGLPDELPRHDVF